MPDRIPLQDSSRRYISAGSARHFLRQIWRELKGWTVTAINSAQMTLTAAMNIILLSFTAFFALLAVLSLLIRDQVMDKPPAAGATSPAQLNTLPVEERVHDLADVLHSQ